MKTAIDSRHHAKHIQPTPEYDPDEQRLTEITVDHTNNTVNNDSSFIITQSPAKEPTTNPIGAVIQNSQTLEMALDYHPAETITGRSTASVPHLSDRTEIYTTTPHSRRIKKSLLMPLIYTEETSVR